MGLCDFAAPGSEVTVISPQRPPDFVEHDTHMEVEGRSVHFVEAEVTDREAYARAGVATAHAVVLGDVQAEDAKQSDARMLTSLLMVQDVCNTSCTSGKPPHVVACLQHSGGWLDGCTAQSVMQTDRTLVDTRRSTAVLN